MGHAIRRGGSDAAIAGDAQRCAFSPAETQDPWVPRSPAPGHPSVHASLGLWRLLLAS